MTFWCLRSRAFLSRVDGRALLSEQTLEGIWNDPSMNTGIRYVIWDGWTAYKS